MRLDKKQRRSARANVLQGADRMLRHPDQIHYTQGTARWEGINRRLRVVRGQYPKHADCSSMVTWMLWNALTHALRDLTITDVVNGLGWRAGYTGTGVQHGKHIDRPTLVGDVCYYGGSWPYKHEAIYIGRGMVFSFGSEAGPYKLPVHYRADLRKVRRYILAP